MPKYPHIVQKESNFAKNQQFTGFYMPDLEVDKLYKIFPYGCEYSNISEYAIYLDGKSVIDWFYEMKQKDFEKSHEFFNKMEALKKENRWLLWDWGDLLHDGYWPMWDKNLNLVCGKGKIKPNKHTVIILLDKVPEKVNKLWKQIVESYITPLQKLVEDYR